MALEKILVSTSLGRRALDPKDRVYSYSEGDFLEKPVNEVNIGESLLYRKEHIRSSLEEIEPYLRMSKRYSSSEEKLYVPNSQGEMIPKLRAEIIRGAAERGIIDEEDIDKKALKDGKDISEDSYSSIRNKIKDLLKSKDIKVTDTTIRNWIDGKTLSPRDWEAYKALSGINPIFNKFDSSNKDHDGYFFNYKLHTVIRQGVMRWLSNPYYKPPKGTHGPKKKSLGIGLEDEINLVFNHFIRDVNNEYAVAQVLDMETIPEGDPRSQKKLHGVSLKKGIFTGNLSGLRKRPISEVIDSRNTFIDALYQIVDKSYGLQINEYVSNIPHDQVSCPTFEEATKNGSLKEILNSPLGPLMKDALEKQLDEQKKNSHDLIKKYSSRFFAAEIIRNHISVHNEPKFNNFETYQLDKVSSIDFNPLYEKFISDLRTGSIDQLSGLDPGTTLKVIDLLKSNHRNIPSSVFNYQDRFGKLILLETQLMGQNALGGRSREINKRKTSIQRELKKIKERLRAYDDYFQNKDPRVFELGLPVSSEERKNILRKNHLEQISNL